MHVLPELFRFHVPSNGIPDACPNEDTVKKSSWVACWPPMFEEVGFRQNSSSALAGKLKIL
jgi:hypothetical protein